MIGGWISLGEFFSTDAEIMENHSVKDTEASLFCYASGLLRYHPVSYRCSLGLHLDILRPRRDDRRPALAETRAKYEETILIEALGEPYKYGENMGWRRLVPRFIPIRVCRL
ncbi:MAG: hypothetical protein R3D26_03835 [Cyanobacteriota/Melainabacteria group bacterium]